MVEAAALQPAPAEPPRDDGAVMRLDASALDGLEPFRSKNLVEDGKVCLINLDALVAAFGDRWPSRREGVYEHVERTLDRQTGGASYAMRVSQTDYLVAVPGMGPFGVQAACLRAIREVLGHFLGAVKPTHLRVNQVTSLEGDAVSSKPVDPRGAIEGEAREAAARRVAEEAKDPTLMSPERWAPFVAGNGREVRVSCKLEPVFETSRHQRIGYRMARRVVYVDKGDELPAFEIANLTRADLIRIDMATIARGLARLDAEDFDGDKELSLIVPVSYITLSSLEGRKLLKAAFENVRQQVKRGVICEICDIEGVPQAQLLSAVSLIKPSCLFVVGHLSGDTPVVTSSMNDTGLHAMSINCPRHLSGDAEFLGWARESIKIAKRVTRSVMVYGCDSPRRLAMAGLMEATHASLAAG